MKTGIVFICWACTLLGIIVALTISNINQSLETEKYRLNFESMREELESYYRTQARGMDPGFVCKFKVNQ